MKNITLITLLLLISSNLFAKTSKEIWLEFSGTNYCQPGFCADNIPSRPLELALKFYKKNQDKILNDDYIGIIDFRMKSTEKRFFILNLKNGSVESMLVTHGKKSETENAFAGEFSNEIGSEKSSLGFYSTGFDTYEGKHGESLKLKGLSSTNSNAFERGIVIHAADYATQSFVDARGRLGLSQGCPAVSPNKIKTVIAKLKGKALLFIYAKEFESTLK